MSYWVITAKFCFLFMQYVYHRLAKVSAHCSSSQLQTNGASINAISGHHDRGKIALEDLLLQQHGLTQNDTCPPLTTHSAELAPTHVRGAGSAILPCA